MGREAKGVTSEGMDATKGNRKRAREMEAKQHKRS